jgi:hypothetical protein
MLPQDFFINFVENFSNLFSDDKLDKNKILQSIGHSYSTIKLTISLLEFLKFDHAT